MRADGQVLSFHAVLGSIESGRSVVVEGAGIPWFAWLAALVALFGILPLVVAYLVWGERKVAARFQDRIGPNRVGPFGLLQPIADAIKLITKESIVPRTADRWAHVLGPVILLVAAFLTLSVIPIGVSGPPVPVSPESLVAGALVERIYPAIAASSPPGGLLLLLAASSLSSLGIFLAGWSGRSKYALLGGMRAVAQLVSYELPQVLAAIPIILWTGSLSLVAIQSAQLDHGWFLASPPGLIGFALLLVSGLAETNRAPFDLPEAESEIIAGYHTEYSGMRWGLFFLAEYLAIVSICCQLTVLYLGGGTLPWVGAPVGLAGGGIGSLILLNAFLVGVFVAKVVMLVFVFFWVRATLPRVRIDRLMDLAWKALIPLGLWNVMVAAAWIELTDGPGDSRIVAWAVSLAMLAPVLWLLTLIFRPGKPKAQRFQIQPVSNSWSLESRAEMAEAQRT